MRIVFRCDPLLEPHLPRPVLARTALPDWLRTMPNREHSPTHGQPVRTVKQCLPCDVTVRDGALSWHWDCPTPSVQAHPRSPISFHVPEQVAGTPLHRPDQVLVKFNSFWTIELEPNWSLFATHPVNRDDLPFRLVTGLVDADRFNDVGILFPAAWTDPGFNGTLPRGMPVAQCFAVPRAAPDLVFETFSPDRAASYQATATSLLSEPGVYRRRFRSRRSRAQTPPERPKVEV
jgi:hypothetical protein